MEKSKKEWTESKQKEHTNSSEPQDKENAQLHFWGKKRKLNL